MPEPKRLPGLVVVTSDVFARLDTIDGGISDLRQENAKTRDALTALSNKVSRLSPGGRWAKVVERVLIAAIAAFLGARELAPASSAQARERPPVAEGDAR